MKKQRRYNYKPEWREILAKSEAMREQGLPYKIICKKVKTSYIVLYSWKKRLEREYAR